METIRVQKINWTAKPEWEGKLIVYDDEFSFGISYQKGNAISSVFMGYRDISKPELDSLYYKLKKLILNQFDKNEKETKKEIKEKGLVSTMESKLYLLLLLEKIENVEADGLIKLKKENII